MFILVANQAGVREARGLYVVKPYTLGRSGGYSWGRARDLADPFCYFCRMVVSSGPDYSSDVSRHAVGAAGRATGNAVPRIRHIPSGVRYLRQGILLGLPTLLNRPGVPSRPGR